MREEMIVVGGGLAGAEATYQLARCGIAVTLYEMRPAKMTPVHISGNLAELVCSNSFKSDSLENASGVLKEEMRRLDSVILEAADLSKIPAGKALAVDRQLFSQLVHQKVTSLPNVRLVSEEITEIPDTDCIIATGPLTSPPLAEALRKFLGADYLYFFDAISPLIETDSIHLEKVFRASRYGHGSDDYINCPLNEEEYIRFVEELLKAETVELHDFEADLLFEGCLPLEIMAQRGVDTLRFGPLKPVGLVDPRTKKQPYAVVQLRQENLGNTEVGMVGFQTRLKYPEQKRVFRMIPGLEDAEFTRYGRMHKNLFVNAPILLDRYLRVRRNPRIFLAGQITGVEGYLESAATGLMAGLQASRILRGDAPIDFPPTTALGALVHYLTAPTGNFQPSNITFGMFAPLPESIPQKRLRNEALAYRGLSDLERLFFRKI